MTDKEKILAKIESLLNETNYEPFTDEVFGRIQTLKELKSYIDSLEVKEVDLDKEIEEQCKKVNQLAVGKELRNICRHFFELGLKVQKGE